MKLKRASLLTATVDVDLDQTKHLVGVILASRQACLELSRDELDLANVRAQMSTQDQPTQRASHHRTSASLLHPQSENLPSHILLPALHVTVSP